MNPQLSDVTHLTSICVLEWKTLGVHGEFYNLGNLDPCVEGDFCVGAVWGRQWVTENGLQVADTVSRLKDLYPRAREARRPGAFEHWVLERGANLCGPDALGGLVAETFNGRVTSRRRVSRSVTPPTNPRRPAQAAIGQERNTCAADYRLVVMAARKASSALSRS